MKDKTKLEIIIVWIILLVLLLVLMFFDPSITGFIVSEKEYNYTESLSLEFNETREFTWIPSNDGALKSLKLDGSYVKGGNVRIYLKQDDTQYLIFDSEEINESLSVITGLVISNETEKKLTSEQNETLLLNGTEEIPELNTSETINGSMIINEDIIINESQDLKITPEINITTQQNETTNLTTTLNNTITINLEYKDDSVYDIDNDGFEELQGVIDFTVEDSEFNFIPDKDNLCTLWTVSSIDSGEETTVCYGSGLCCNEFNILSTQESWDDVFILYYGQYGAENENIVRAKIYSGNTSSAESELHARFIEPDLTYFEDVCEETCLLPELNNQSYQLIFELENTTLSVSSISYSMINEVTTNNPPLLEEIMPDVNIYINRNYTVNLTNYFSDQDSDSLVYSYYEIDNISIIINGSIATIIPDSSFVGVTYTFFKANDSEFSEVSNIFKINVTYPPDEETIQLKAKAGKPVKWIKRSSNNTIILPDYAYNITILSKTGDNYLKLEEEKIKVNSDGKVKALKEYEKDQKAKKAKKDKDTFLFNSKGNEKALEEDPDLVSELPEDSTDNSTVVIINSTGELFEVSYESEAPLLIEKNLTGTNKEVTISSDIGYKDVLAYTKITESPRNSIRLFWYINDTKVDVTGSEEINLTFLDTNNNSLIDMLEWNVPHLSNQTFEISITILNVQSYPTVGGNWTVMFNTTGEADLIIKAINETTFEEIPANLSTEDDLTFLEVTCNGSTLNDTYIVSSDNISMPLEVYNIKRRIEEIRERLDELG